MADETVNFTTKIDGFLEISGVVAAILAKNISLGAPCKRSQVGAVIVNRDGLVVAADFNRGGPYTPSCLDGGCPRADASLEEVPPGSQYDTGPGRCISVHAEANAILSAGRMQCKDATMYCTREPCWWCEKLAMEVKISRIKWPEGEKVYASTVDSK